MKRVLLLSFILLCASVAGYAQSSVFNATDNRPYWGVRVAYELACPGNVDMKNGVKVDALGNGSGVSFTGVYNLPVIYNFYFEPGVTIAYNTWSINKELINKWLNELPGFSGVDAKNASVRMWDLRIPLMGGYRFDVLPEWSVSVFTGPELSLGISAHENVDLGTVTVTDGLYGSKGVLNRMDVKWRFGAGVTFRKHFHAEISGAAGICDRYDGPWSMRTNLFDISLGYNF